MNQGKSLSSENIGHATGERGTKSDDFARGGFICLIADAERVIPSATADNVALFFAPILLLI